MTQKVDSNEEAIYIAGYIAKTLNHKVSGLEIFNEATHYTKGAKIQYVNVSTLEDMVLLALPMITDEDEDEFDITSEYGVFSYVYNFDAPQCSELGYVFFTKKSGRLVRSA